MRDWGPDTWWQNIRLPYWPMLESGDFAEQDVVFDYYLRHVPFLRARTELLFNVSADEAGFWEVETGTAFGALSAVDYGICGTSGYPRPPGVPPWLGNNPYVLLDRYGDGPMAELALMMLDRWRYDQDDAALQRRLPWAVGAVNFFAFIFPNRTSEGKVVVHPTQSLETWWCPWCVAAAGRGKKGAPRSLGARTNPPSQPAARAARASRPCAGPSRTRTA